MIAPLHNRAARAALRRICTGMLLALALLLLRAGPARAQAPAVPPAAPGAAPPAAVVAGPGAPAGGGPAVRPGEIHVRFYVPLIDQYSFVVHPFYQITEDPAYLQGKAATALGFRIGHRNADENSIFLARGIHALPPLGIEGVMGIDLPFPRGFGFGLDYTPLSQTDTNAANSDGAVTAISMDAYLYTGTLRFYFFNPNEPGINYFVGLGLGFLEGTVKVPVAGASPLFLNFSQYPVGSTRLGLETRGDHWGFRYELAIINADRVHLSYNPYPDVLGNGPNTTNPDFSGSVVRIALFYHF
jgi:hypothetical protein